MRSLLMIALFFGGIGLGLLILSVGCSDTKPPQKYRIELWSGGEKVREWTSIGRVCESGSPDGFRFRDQETGRVVRITGDIVVTAIE